MSNEPNDSDDENEYFHEFSGETEEIALIKRKCDVCGSEAVSLGGVGTDCEDPLCGGEYVGRSGVQVVTVHSEQAETYREKFPEQVAE